VWSKSTRFSKNNASGSYKIKLCWTWKQKIQTVFTDGFCIDGMIGCAVFLPNEVANRLHQFLLQNFTPSSTSTYSRINLIVIYSTTFSSLESIEQLFPTHHLFLNRIQDVIHDLAVWVPWHYYIQGYKTTDKAAKQTNAVRWPLAIWNRSTIKKHAELRRLYF
jgi:hypothetical protein